MMTQHHEQRRQRAIAQYLAGAKIDDICRQMVCAKSWLYKWKARDQPDTASWARAQSRRPKNHAAKTPPSIEPAVLELRRTFGQNGQSCGAQASRQALEQQGITAVPSLRTIYRILARHEKEER